MYIYNIFYRFGESSVSSGDDASKSFFGTIAAFARAFKQAVADIKSHKEQQQKKKSVLKTSHVPKKVSQVSNKIVKNAENLQPNLNLFENFHSAQLKPSDQIISEFKSRLATQESFSPLLENEIEFEE